MCPLPNQRPCLQDDLVFVVGKLDGLMVVGFRRHNADDVVATALAVEPMKFVYRGRLCAGPLASPLGSFSA